VQLSALRLFDLPALQTRLLENVCMHYWYAGFGLAISSYAYYLPHQLPVTFLQDVYPNVGTLFLYEISECFVCTSPQQYHHGEPVTFPPALVFSKQQCTLRSWDIDQTDHQICGRFLRTYCELMMWDLGSRRARLRSFFASLCCQALGFGPPFLDPFFNLWTNSFFRPDTGNPF